MKKGHYLIKYNCVTKLSTNYENKLTLTEEKDFYMM